MTESKLNIPNFKIAELAGAAKVDPRTARAWLLGRKVSDSSKARLEPAAKQLDLVRTTPEPVQVQS